MPVPNLNNPPVWRKTQLENAGAINVGRVTNFQLTNTLNPLFHRKYWEISSADYRLLLPSLYLASHWIEVALPYISTFLPSSRLHAELDGDLSCVLFNKEFTEEDLQNARDELADVAKSVVWQVDGAMRASHGWLGVTRTTPQPRPWDPISSGSIKYYDGIAQGIGKARRPLIVGIMQEYVDALRRTKEDDEIHLRAAFMAAYTIFHEVGHVIWLQDFRAWDSENMEPWVDEDCWSELGLAMGARIFNGFNPNVADLPGCTWHEFTTPLYWESFPNTKTKSTPWKTLYSIPMQFMQDCFTDSFWDELGEVDIGWSKRARQALNPKDPRNKYPPPARAMEIQFGDWDDVGGGDFYEEGYDLENWNSDKSTSGELRLAWKRKFCDRTSYGKESVWDYLTPQDKQWVKGKGARLVDATGVETTGEKDEQDSQVGSKPRKRAGTASIELPTIEAPVEPKFESQIKPIMLEQDVHLPFENMEQPRYQNLVRIRVKYRPEGEFGTHILTSTSSNKRGHSEFKEGSDDERPSKKRKGHNQTFTNTSMAAAARAKIEEWSPRNLERSLTHQEAYDLCQKFGVEFGDFYDNAQWQLANLNYENSDDRYLIERMRLAAFNDEIDKNRGESSDDVKALLALTTELKNSVPNWGPLGCKAFCRTNKLPEDGSRGEILTHIWNRFETEEGKLTEALLNLRKADGQSSNIDEDGYFRELSKMNTISKVEYINDLIARNDLQTWGSLKCRRERVARFLHFEKTGSHPSRNTWNRTFDGVETYIFTCNLNSTTIGSLLSSLAIEGQFPFHAKLTLLKDNQYRDYLNKENNKLAGALHWCGESVIDLQLTVTFLPIPGERKSEKPPPIYQPRNIAPMKKRFVDDSIKRKADVIAGREIPTVAERLENVQKFGEILKNAFTEDGGRNALRPNGRIIKSTSGVAILSNLENMMDAENEFLKAAGAGDYEDMNVDDEEDRLAGMPGSHMANLYNGL